MINLRIFGSSLGDVGEERRLTGRVIDIERLQQEWNGRVTLQARRGSAGIGAGDFWKS